MISLAKQEETGRYKTCSVHSREAGCFQEIKISYIILNVL